MQYGNPGEAVESGSRAHAGNCTIALARRSRRQDDGSKKCGGAVADIVKASDHSFHAGLLAPSVNLFVDMPVVPLNKLEQGLQHSWYQGQVVVNLKCAVFRSSSAWHHWAQLARQVINRACGLGKVPPFPSLQRFHDAPRHLQAKVWPHIPVITVSATDGGTDHRNNTTSNKAEMLAFLVFLKMAFMALFRNAPSGS